jgi:O-antigen/teichoic acid export membrane protein
MIFLNLFLFFYRAPFKFEFALRIEHVNTLVILGFPMLLGTVGFYLITLSVRSFVSHFYPLHDIGLFTLGLSIGNAVMLGLNAVSWTFYSTILANTCGDVDQAVQYIRKVNVIFSTCLAITIFGGILLLPVLFYFLPQYNQFYDGIVIMVLSQLFMSVSFGYSCVLTARKKQNSIAVISFSTLAVTVVLSYIVGLMKLPMLFQAVVILGAMTCYSAQICYSATRALNIEFRAALWRELFSYKILVPAFVLIGMVLLKLPHILGVFPFVLVVVLMFRDIVEAWKLTFGKSQAVE